MPYQRQYMPARQGGPDIMALLSMILGAGGAEVEAVPNVAVTGASAAPSPGPIPIHVPKTSPVKDVFTGMPTVTYRAKNPKAQMWSGGAGTKEANRLNELILQNRLASQGAAANLNTGMMNRNNIIINPENLAAAHRPEAFRTPAQATTSIDVAEEAEKAKNVEAATRARFENTYGPPLWQLQNEAERTGLTYQNLLAKPKFEATVSGLKTGMGMDETALAQAKENLAISKAPQPISTSPWSTMSLYDRQKGNVTPIFQGQKPIPLTKELASRIALYKQIGKPLTPELQAALDASLPQELGTGYSLETGMGAGAPKRTTGSVNGVPVEIITFTDGKMIIRDIK